MEISIQRYIILYIHFKEPIIKLNKYFGSLPVQLETKKK